MIQLRFVGEYEGDRIIKKLQYREMLGSLSEEGFFVPNGLWSEWKYVEYVGIV
jgi:hypothetical protein